MSLYLPIPVSPLSRTLSNSERTCDSLYLDFLRSKLFVGSGHNVISFAGQDLSGAKLNACNNGCVGSDGIDLSGLDLSGANLKRANLNRSKMIGADLQKADLRGANIGNVDFTNANLRDAKVDSPNVFTQANAILHGTIM